jgi:signal transduction histidine kinase
VRRSRARIVAAADEERKRLERNLHDGAQQHLVASLLALRVLRAQARDPETANGIERAVEELEEAVDELRELARGIHPAALTERGLDSALEQLARRSPVPVAVEAPPRRYPEPVEAAAYYVVSEALANVAKYARASVSVRVTETGSGIVVEVVDDGVGGADASRGSGLSGLADRVAALDGTLAVESPAGAGTRVRAELPLPQLTG